MTSVTPWSSSRRTPSTLNASIEITCTSNGLSAVPSARRNSASLASSPGRSAGSPPPCIQPSPVLAARRSIASLCPPNRIGMGSVGTGESLTGGIFTNSPSYSK